MSKHLFPSSRARGNTSLRSTSLDYQTLETRNLLATVVATYATDFPTGEATPKAGWNYQWNAPVSGDLSSGAIDDTSSQFKSLAPAASGRDWTPDGDLNPLTNSESAYLKLSATGGHPGYGASNLPGNVDRYAIASFTVSQTGVYSIAESFVSLYPRFLGAQTNGLEVRVFTNSKFPVDVIDVRQNTIAYFDNSLGLLSSGDTIHVAVGSNSDLSFDYFKMDFSIVRNSELDSVVGSYQDDFDPRSPSPYGWNYLWNAPQGWVAGNNPGSWFSNPIGTQQNYVPLIPVDSSLTADGDLNGLNSEPDYFLQLNAEGGTAGNGYENRYLYDRFAIASYTVRDSGQYGIANSIVSVSAQSDDGIEIYVHTSAEAGLAKQNLFIEGGRSGSFDTELGHLEKGETIYVAFGANQNHVHDRFETDFEIVRALPRAAPDLSLLDQPLEVINANESRFGVAGAIPNDNQNDWEAISNAIAAAGNGNKEITLEPGIYNISSNELDRDKPLFDIRRMENLVINGNGSTLIVGEHFRELFRTSASSNIVFENFIVDYAERVASNAPESSDLYRPLTFTQGIITDVDPIQRAFTVRVNLDAFLAPDASFTTRYGPNFGYAIDPAVNGRLKTNSPWHYATLGIEKSTASDEFRILTYEVEGLDIGDKFVLQRRVNSSPIFGIYHDSTNVSFVGVTAYSSPSTFMTSINSESINIVDSHITIRPDDWRRTNNTQRWKSINADGVHAQANRIGPWIENSTFSGLGDDVMNFYSLPMTILEQPNSRRLVLASLDFEQVASVSDSALKVGDRLSFFDPVAGKVVEEARIVSQHSEIRSDPANPSRTINTRVVELDQSLSGLLPGTHGDEPKYRNETIVYNRDSSQGAMVQGNLIANSRRYGTLLLADNSQLVDNVFEGLGDSAIAIHNELSWPLGAFTVNTLIQGNQFTSNGVTSYYLTNDFHTGTISIKASYYGEPGVASNGLNQLLDSDVQLFSNLRILDNTFRDWHKTAISVRNSESVLIQGNKILNPALPEYFGLSLDLHFSRNVLFKSNLVLENV